MANTPVNLCIGQIYGRDGIYLDDVEHLPISNTLSLIGEINPRLVTAYNGRADWLGYRLVFKNVCYYEQCSLEYFNCDVISSFDQVNHSELLKKHSKNAEQHYIVSTYDIVFSVIAKSFEFKISDERIED